MQRKTKVNYLSSLYCGSIILMLTIQNVFSQKELPATMQYQGLTATQVIAFAQARRAELDSTLKDYTCLTYTKSTTSSQDTPEEISQLEETASRIYWKFPDKFKEIILGNKESLKKGVKARVDFSLGIIRANYSERITLGLINVPSPIGPDTFKFYHFKLLGRVRMGATEVYELEVSPRSRYKPLIVGKIWIEDDTFTLVGADFSFNRATNLPQFVTSIRMKLEYIRFFKKYWLFSKQVIEVEGYVPPFWRGFAVRTTYFSDYKINTHLSEEKLKGPALEIHPDADNPDSSVWKNRRPLTAAEKKLCAEQNNPKSKATSTENSPGTHTIKQETWTLHPTHFADFLHDNRVEGLFLGFGLHLKYQLNMNACPIQTINFIF